MEGTLFRNSTIFFSTIKGSYCPAVFKFGDDESVLTTSIPPIQYHKSVSKSLPDYSSVHVGHLYDLSTNENSTDSMVESMITVEWG